MFQNQKLRWLLCTALLLLGGAARAASVLFVATGNVPQGKFHQLQEIARPHGIDVEVRYINSLPADVDAGLWAGRDAVFFDSYLQDEVRARLTRALPALKAPNAWLYDQQPAWGGGLPEAVARRTARGNGKARAFVVGKGKDALAFVSVDLVGWFAAYDGEQAPYGIDATREKIADALNSRGYDIGRESVIVSSTHVHAAPTVVGIWGTLDGEYLKKVSDAAVTAASEAADAARPSEIWTGVGDIRSFIWQNGQGTNHPDGFEYDNALPILWARDPDTGATNALYANVPNHPDQYQVDDNNFEMSADWPGYARRKLDALNGGTAVLAAGTLGRQEPPGSVTAYSEVEAQGEIVANEIQRTMAKSTPLTDDTIAASEQFMETPADNDDLLLGISIFTYPGACIDGIERCTIPRSKAPPYMNEVSGEDVIGTYVEAARIGDVAFATNPGEAFPEVNFAIRDGVTGPRQVNVIAQAGDMLGYYYQRADYTDQQFGSSDFEDYNVGPELGQANANSALAGLNEIGFTATPETVHAAFESSVASKPGIQWYPDEYESTDPTFNILGSAARSQDGTAPVPTSISWDFGDTTTGTTSVGVRPLSRSLTNCSATRWNTRSAWSTPSAKARFRCTSPPAATVDLRSS